MTLREPDTTRPMTPPRGMKQRLLIAILRTAKSLGLFALARRLTADQLRILCYHGSAIDDENHFRPGLFMTAATFARRMAFLDDARYPVLALGDAVERLYAGTLPPSATAITIDDGWYGTYRNQVPVLEAHGFPATLYVATYYVERQTQVFNVALSYVLWKRGIERLPAATVDAVIGREPSADDLLDAEGVWKTLFEHAESLDGADARQALLRRFCDAVDFDWQALENNRIISFMNANEAREAGAGVVDLQLHTHRHRFPDTSLADARREIEDNRAALSRLGSTGTTHFCYPNGTYTNANVAYLPDLGIETATTTHPGFNRKSRPRYLLRRFLDSEAISDIEFEAEMSGFLELIRLMGYSI